MTKLSGHSLPLRHLLDVMVKQGQVTTVNSPIGNFKNAILALCDMKFSWAHIVSVPCPGAGNIP